MLQAGRGLARPVERFECMRACNRSLHDGAGIDVSLCVCCVLIVCAGVIGCCGGAVLCVLRDEQFVSLRWAGVRWYVAVYGAAHAGPCGECGRQGLAWQGGVGSDTPCACFALHNHGCAAFMLTTV